MEVAVPHLSRHTRFSTSPSYTLHVVRGGKALGNEGRSGGGRGRPGTGIWPGTSRSPGDCQSLFAALSATSFHPNSPGHHSSPFCFLESAVGSSEQRLPLVFHKLRSPSTCSGKPSRCGNRATLSIPRGQQPVLGCLPIT